MRLQLKTKNNNLYTECYATLFSDPNETINSFACDYNDYYKMLSQQKNITIIYERIYASQNNITALKEARAAYSMGCFSLPNYFINDKPETSVQLYYVVGDLRSEIIQYNSNNIGLQVEVDRDKFIYFMGLHQEDKSDRKSELANTFKELAQMLNDRNMTMKNVFRTWFWLEHILDWYDVFNQTRNSFYIEQELLGASNHLPASTGIGMNSVGGFGLFDVFACSNLKRFVFKELSKSQNSAYNYGSAFSREVIVNTYSGLSCFISGTAAIDKNGITTSIGNIDGQIHDTINNLQVILSTKKNAKVLTATVYCKDLKVEKRFNELYKHLDWNYTIVIADVCRDNLLFEIEMVVSVHD